MAYDPINGNTVTIKKGAKAPTTMDALIKASIERNLAKYDSTIFAETTDYVFVPMVAGNATVIENCAIVTNCVGEKVIDVSIFEMTDGCNLCIREMTRGAKDLYEINVLNEPSPILRQRTTVLQAMNVLNSALKTSWLGNKAYTTSDMASAALLPAYKLENGFWTKLVGLSPAPPNVPITNNALTTPPTQIAISQVQVLDILDAMIAAQSQTLRSIDDAEKVFIVTNEMFQALDAVVRREALTNLLVYGFDQITNERYIRYGAFKIYSNNDLSNAIRDLDLVGTGNDLLQLPHRAILQIGLPFFGMVNMPVFKEFYKETTSNWEAATTQTVISPNPYGASFYVTAY